MFAELSLEGGCVPSPENIWNNAQKNGNITNDTGEQVRTKQPQSTLEELLAMERAKNEALQAELIKARHDNDEWVRAASALVNALLMSPKQNINYASEVSKLLENALSSLTFVEKVRYVNCSFPSSAGKAPTVRLNEWNSLNDSEWHLSWASSWACEVCVDGRQFGLPFSTLLRVASLRIVGTLKLAFAHNLSNLSISFVSMPDTNLDVTCKLLIGTLPVPIQETMGGLIKDVALRWIQENLVAPKYHTINLHSRPTHLTDDEIELATKAALIGEARAREFKSTRSISR
mmetsp:Transcript_7072/g.9914  ORF Transcript_7072/g.9914 Transcript_7072/m.9914 type:complete len:289 (-) Transcript_7072:1452-2318(-)